MYLASCSLDVVGNAPFCSCIPLLVILSFLGVFVTAPSSLLANSNTAYIANDNNVFLWIPRHFLGLLRRTQNLSQLVEAFATGDRCSIDTMTCHAFVNLVILLNKIFISIFVTLDFPILYVAADINVLQKRIIL